VGALCAPKLVILRRALHEDSTYNLGAIVARHLHLNRTRGMIHGGIFATRLACHFNVQIREHDPLLSKVYLDREAMLEHHFLDEGHHL
jgi:hypothetical protein